MTTTVGSVADQSERPLRRDAERNRQLILQVAADVFAEHGLDAGFEEIARRAGVGVGTVYRRFPDRNRLVAALFEQSMAEIVAMAEAALALPDAWVGLCQFIESTLEKQTRDKGLKEVMATAGNADDQFTHVGHHLVPVVAALLDRAKEQGTLRRDIEVTDLAVVNLMISSAVTASQPELWRRYLTLFLDSLRQDRQPATPLPLAAPRAEEMAELLGKQPYPGRPSAALPKDRTGSGPAQPESRDLPSEPKRHESAGRHSL